jgi:hypothetical protein
MVSNNPTPTPTPHVPPNENKKKTAYRPPPGLRTSRAGWIIETTEHRNQKPRKNKTMKTHLQKTLQALTPSISIQTLWEPDPDAGTVSQNCDGFTREDDDQWQAWQSEIRATAIIDGEEITCSAYLGGTFEQAGDRPEYSNPDISGYEPQMTEEALTELRERIPAGNVYADACRSQIGAALGYLKKFRRERWEAQQAPAPAP